MFLHTQKPSQIPFSGSQSNWVEGFNYNHLQKNKYSCSTPLFTRLHSIPESKQTAFFIGLPSPPTFPPKRELAASREKENLVYDLSLLC